MLFERLFKSKAAGLIGCDIGIVVGENVELAVEPKRHSRLYKVIKADKAALFDASKPGNIPIIAR